MNFLNHFTQPFRSYSSELKLTLLFFLLGLILSFSGIADVEVIREAILEKFAQFKNLHGIHLSLTIFLNNLQVVAISFYLGIFFGFVPFFVGVVNGLVVGLVFMMSDKSPLYIIVKLIPHGVFELPAIFLAIALGFSLGKWVIERDKIVYIKEQLIEGTKIFVTVIIPLLLIAGIIEGIAIEFGR